MSLFAKAKKAREDKKGFTLVELIVVLVILAILAAILVPALLGWIDRAREKQYVLAARNVVLAAQTIADEAYAAGPTAVSNVETYVIGKQADIGKIADVTGLAITSLGLTTTATAGSSHDDYTIKTAEFTFTSGSDTILAKLSAGAWEITKNPAP